ncbi:hypothetical protein HEQ75_27465, partial [Roseomonas sp. BU-1]|nr:hypothetical protein [Falsiroseomonas selenitidurans]
MRLLRAFLLGAAFAALTLGSARAQIETREGIALQNQILQLRQEVEMLRRSGPSLPPPAPGNSALGARPPAASGGPPQAELLGTLLDRVARMEEDLRSLRGRAEENEFRERTLRERLEKLEGDIDFRLQQLEGQRQGNAAPAARPPVAAATPPATPNRPAPAPATCS